jgi:hypothetical protein
MIKSLTAIIAAVFFVQLNAQSIYNVPVSGKPNTIIFEVKNDLDKPVLNTEISVCEVPDWIIFEDKDVIVGKIPGHGKADAEFHFRLLTPPDYEEMHEIMFDVVKSSGESFQKIITIKPMPPADYELFNNYPNPFNPSTIIKYSIPSEGIVNLWVFNILGEKVMTLVNENLKAGTYEINFNASGLASGIYFYTLQAENYMNSKKMILMK